VTDGEWLNARLHMSADNLRRACAGYAQLPAPETYRHLVNCMASYQEAYFDWSEANKEKV
jgi:hypothetical protein